MIFRSTTTSALVLVGGISTTFGQQHVALRGSAKYSNTLPEFYLENVAHHRHHAPITDVKKDDWVKQCAATFKEYNIPGNPQLNRSNFYLIEEPSGLCADALSCAFDKCYGSTDGGEDNEAIQCIYNQTDLASMSYDDIESSCELPKSALPKSIMFPENAADVIAAIKHAKKHQLQVSVKSTGHSYTGAHTKAGTLMLNMRDYTKYALGDDKIVECKQEISPNAEVGDACTLAVARGKGAYIHVGGGQTWSEVYNTVEASSANLDKAYGIAGGGAGSVGAAGGWLSGGGLSTGYERTYGLGVDQILELEVALADGNHVRVFPIEWEHVDGYYTPQTRKVAALCNTNVVADESKWKWEECTDLVVSSDDIWMSVRGGGGGSFAITLSVKYQLFDQNPFQYIPTGFGGLAAASAFDDNCKVAYDTMLAKFKADKTGDMFAEMERTYTLFLIDFLFAPEKIGLSKADSLSCGGPQTMFMYKTANLLSCWGEAPALPAISSAWKRSIAATNLAKSDEELGELVGDWTFLDASSFGSPFKSYPDFVKFAGRISLEGVYPADVVPDSPLPMSHGLSEKQIGSYCSINLPLALLQTNDEAERVMLHKILSTVGGEHTTGGNVAQLSDGMDAVPFTERNSGQSSISFQAAIDLHGESLLTDYLTAVYTYSEGEIDGFPGFYEYNHICPDAPTPSKADWTKSCDPEKEECFTIQETVWGSELYRKLQDIKSNIDPTNMFDCYPCVKPNDE
jgi:hypothetical protein